MALLETSVRIGGLLAACTALAGCLGGGGGGGGAAGGQSIIPDLIAARAAIVETGGTPNVRETGTATYTGTAMFDLREFDTGAPIIGNARSDVVLNVNFGAAVNPVTGDLRNFSGTLNGEEYTAPDSLRLPVTTSQIVRISLDPNDPNLPPGVGDILAGVPGAAGLEPGGVVLTLTGSATVDGVSGSSTLNLGGAFYGPNEEAIIADGGGTLFIGGQAPLIATGGLFAER